MRAGASHLADRDTLTRVRIPVLPHGLMLGRGVDDTPLTIRLFRAGPTTLALAGRLWLGQLVALRAAAVGARVVVRTGRPRQWAPLAEATAGANPLAIVEPEFDGPVGAGMTTPVLHLVDAGTTRPPRLTLGPWQSQLTLLPALTMVAMPVLLDADLVLLQRLTEAETRFLPPTLGLTPEMVGHLLRMPDHGVTASGSGGTRYLTVSPSELEWRLFENAGG